MSVCILDKLVNSILGRPAATAGVPTGSKPSLLKLAKPGDHATDCLFAAYSILVIINDITGKLYDKKAISIPIIEQLLQDIESWKRKLPASVWTSSSPASEQPSPKSSPSHAGAIGKVHVSCLYYFAVTLVTRPLLISALTAQPNGRDAYSHLTAACLDAAMYLAQTCVEAYTAGLLRGNMCIMK